MSIIVMYVYVWVVSEEWEWLCTEGQPELTGNLNTKQARSCEHKILAVQWDGYSEVIIEYIKSLVSEMMVGSNDGCKAIEKWWSWSIKSEL